MADTLLIVASVMWRHVASVATGPGIRVAQRDRAVVGGAGAVAAEAASGVRHDGDDLDAIPALRVVLLARVGADDAGEQCASALGAVAPGVELRWDRNGVTDQHLVLTTAAGADEHLLIRDRREAGASAGPLIGPDTLRAALAECRAGDVLLVDAPALVDYPDLIRAAYDADVQIVADLHPMTDVPGDVLSLVDVAVVDAAGAGALADGAAAPVSLAVHSAVGSWWGEFQREGFEGAEALAAAEHDAPHRFAGALAATLARGEDRPEAFAAAVDAATGVVPGAATTGVSA